MLPSGELDYPLDPGAVATQPAEPRDAARMMVVHQGDERVEHRRIRDLPEYLRAGDRLVLNRTRVMPARLLLRRIGDGRRTEGLLETALEARRWQALIRHARRFRAGDRLELLPPPHPAGAAERPSAVDHQRAADQPPAAASDPSRSAVLRVLGRREEGVVVEFEGDAPMAELIERFGWTPLPPYILKARERLHQAAEDDDDRRHYQTVFAEGDDRPSVAAPTAGLHFTPELLRAIESRGVRRLEVTLQVGAGTFKPIETPFVEQHRMHSEWFRVGAPVVEELRLAEEDRRRGDGRLVAVGTTSVRVLESLPEVLPEPGTEDLAGETTLMILPGTALRRVDALLTNFHLPRSTLLALVGAFVGLERLRSLYMLAQREGYRFYSYGDAMLIL